MGAQAPSVAPGPNVYANAGSQNVHSNQAGMKAPQGGGGVVDDGDDDFWGGAAPRAAQQSRGGAGGGTGGAGAPASHADDDDENFWDFKDHSKGSERKKEPVRANVSGFCPRGEERRVLLVE